MLLLWDWEKQKVLSKISIGITGVPFSMMAKGGDNTEHEYAFQTSYNLFDPTYVVVTGVDTYKYYHIEANELIEDHF